MTLTAGCTLLMWMGELITKRGIGNGISLLIFASILTGLPIGIRAFVNGGPMEKLFFPLIAITVIVAVVFIQEGQRRIPIQYAKRMVGRRMTTGGSTYMPLRVNMAGVIPIIFAAAIMAFPPTIAQYFPQTQGFINEHFLPTGVPYMVLQGVLIVVFTYFYTAVQFNPVDQADNLRKYGGYIPGIRPGPPTAQYLDRVLTRLTLPGSIYLALIATLPTLFIRYGGFSQATAGALGGTSILIAVGVALDTMRQMESQMMARHLRRLPQVMNVLLLGPQGSGKGTQAKLIASDYGLPHIATGDMLRAAIAADSELGRRVKPILESGQLVPDDLMVQLIRERLSEPDASDGFVLDGFPRTLAQAEALDEMLEEIGRELDVIMEFQLDEDTAIGRMLGRAAEEGRADDTPEVMRTRLELYREMTLPVVEHYRATGKLVGIHADRPIPDVYAEVQQTLEQLRSRAAR